MPCLVIVSAPALGAGGRGFESRYPDKIKRRENYYYYVSMLRKRLASVCNTLSQG
jgi:hypothetical protein